MESGVALYVPSGATLPSPPVEKRLTNRALMQAQGMCRVELTVELHAS